MKKELPNGIEYEVIIPRKGIIKVGTDDEPIVAFSGRNARIQYRLISFALEKSSLIEETYIPGNLSQTEEDLITEWMKIHVSSLFQEIGVKHYIKFHANYKCYYDFLTEELYEANGVREKKGRINGEPFKLPLSDRVIIEALTRYPKSAQTFDDLVDYTALAYPGQRFVLESSMNQKMNTFRKYDDSLRQTFKGTLIKKYTYEGMPSIWAIGLDVNEISLTIKKIFNIVAYGEMIAFFRKESKEINIRMIGETSPMEVLLFLGFDDGLFDYNITDLDKLVNSNSFTSVEGINAFFNRYCVSVNALWKQLEQNIKENLSLSLSASTYYSETKEYPATMDDLREYKPTSERLERSLKQICSEVSELIVNTSVGEDYFDKCDIEVKSDNVIDYTIALILACFSNANTTINESEISTSKNRFRNRLRDLIQNNPIFNYSPEDGSKNVFEWQIEEIRRLLDQVRLEIIEAGLNESVITIDKIYDLINKQSYKDDNSLLPDNKNRRI